MVPALLAGLSGVEGSIKLLFTLSWRPVNELTLDPAAAAAVAVRGEVLLVGASDIGELDVTNGEGAELGDGDDGEREDGRGAGGDALLAVGEAGGAESEEEVRARRLRGGYSEEHSAGASAAPHRHLRAVADRGGKGEDEAGIRRGLQVDARLCGARAVFGHLVVQLQALHLPHRGARAGDAATAASTAALSLDPCAPLSTVTAPSPPLPLRRSEAEPPLPFKERKMSSLPIHIQSVRGNRHSFQHLYTIRCNPSY